MRTRTLALMMGALAVLGVTTGAWSAEGELRKVTGHGFTVSYPAGTENQAKRLLGLAKESIGPSIEINKQISSFLTDPDSISRDIAFLLGYPEKQDKAKTYLLAFKTKSDAMVQCFSNIRLIKKADAITAGTIDAGVLQVTYDKERDEFNMMMSPGELSPDKIKQSFFPVFLNSDGTIRAEDKLDELAVDFMGSNKAMIIAPIHETVATLMAKDLSLYQPFSRWFNEGVSGWITRHVVTKHDPKLAKLANDIFVVNPNSVKLKDKVNFLSWPQRAFQNLRDPGYDPALESAHTQYAIEMITSILGKDGVQDLPKIMREVNFNPNADSDTVINAIKVATGKDAKPTFMSYVPKAVRDGLASGDPKKLLAHAETLAGEKKWSEAAAKIRQALQMTPENVNARLNLACISRELGLKLDSEIHVFLAARLVKQGNHSFHIYSDSLEGNYVLGRFAILMGNLEYAKKFLQPILTANPNHADAKRAMEEIKALEAAAGVTTPTPAR